MGSVVDASAVVAALVVSGPLGGAARRHMAGQLLAAPHLLLFECANVLRRPAARGRVAPELATLIHADLARLPVELWPHRALAARVWELRHDLTAYDAAYVALAELLGAPVLTCDRRLAATPGPRCPFIVGGAPRG